MNVFLKCCKDAIGIIVAYTNVIQTASCTHSHCISLRVLLQRHPVYCVSKNLIAYFVLRSNESCCLSSHLCLYCVQELQAQLAQRAEQYHRLLDKGESMLMARGGEEAGPGATQTQQNLGLLQNKWGSLNSKMDDRRVRVLFVFLLCFFFLNQLHTYIFIKPDRQSWMRPLPWQQVSRHLCRTPSTG